ncbi:hypothetical protein [Spiroplasma endosymbiont of Labia minor]|uniref:hypothetical protein n=1 Tax=Spiroplasma endosymbiont of Labia minor TaxID=3066305 RepID=UPI0030CC0207
MLINIGPWWIFDTIALLIIIIFMIIGMSKGTYVVMYFLGINLVVFLFNLFMVPFVVQAISTPVMKIINDNFDIDNLTKTFSSYMSGFLNQLMSILFPTEAPNISIDAPSFSHKIVSVLVSSIISLSLQIVLLFIFNIVGIIIYFTFLKRKLSKARINRHTDVLFGAILGFIWGIMWTFGMSSVVALPVFKTDTQDIVNQDLGSVDFSDPESVNRFRDIILYGNRYKQKAVTGKMSKIVPKMGLNYTAECFSKYLLLPMAAMPAEGWTGDVSKIPQEILTTLNNTILKGYTSNNYFDISARSCADYGMSDTQSLQRAILESIILMGGLNISDSSFSNGIAPTKSLQGVGSFTILKEQLDNYRQNKRMGKKDFEGFYAANNSIDNNEFLRAANILENSDEETLNQNYIIDILKNPDLLYNWMKNIYYLNQYDLINGTLSFLPDMYSSLVLISGWEIVPGANVSIYTSTDRTDGQNNVVLHYFNDNWQQMVDYTV